MSNFKKDILEAVNNEKIEAVIIGKFGWGSGFKEKEDHLPANERIGEVLTWDEAAPLLNYQYDTGYGAPDCHAIRVYTDKSIYWVTEYDGSTSIDSTFRHPVPHIPDMPGGG